MSEHQETAAHEAEKKEWRDRLNNAFKENGFVYDQQILEMLQQAEFPIMVDFNNVLASNNQPIVVNPEAKKFLEELSKIGEVFIVTTARGWEKVWEFLTSNGLERQVVLMVSGNYVRADYELYGARKQDRELAIDSYFEKISSLGLTSDFEMGLRTSLDEFSETEAAELKRQMIFGGAAANKRLAPVFGKTFKIPMIDDGKMATEHNPGVAGILAPYFEPHPFSGEDLEKINAGRLILEQVVEEVKKIKKSIATPRPIPRP